MAVFKRKIKGKEFRKYYSKFMVRGTQHYYLNRRKEVCNRVKILCGWGRWSRLVANPGDVFQDGFFRRLRSSAAVVMRAFQTAAPRPGDKDD